MPRPNSIFAMENCCADAGVPQQQKDDCTAVTSSRQEGGPSEEKVAADAAAEEERKDEEAQKAEEAKAAVAKTAFFRDEDEGPNRSPVNGQHCTELVLPSVPASNAFRETVTSWSGYGVDQQITALDEFREKLAGKSQRVPDDLTCLRFLRARRMHVNKALDMYERHWDWYTLNVAGRVMSTPTDPILLSILQKSYPALLIGRDSLGRPVKFMDVGQLDMQSLRKQGVIDSQLVDYHIFEMEMLARSLSLRDSSTMEEIQARPGPDVDTSLHARQPLLGHVCIFDTYNCTMSKFLSAIGLWTAIAKINQDNYPEFLGHALFIRTPRPFTMCFEMMKKSFDPATAAKFEVVSGNPYERVAQLVGPSNVPATLCGKERVVGNSNKPAVLEQRLQHRNKRHDQVQPPEGCSACCAIA